MNPWNAGRGSAYLLHRLEEDGLFFWIRPDADKETRLDAQTAKVDEGDVLFASEAPWLAALKNEPMAFPLGHHDDRVDALSQFLYRFGHGRPQNLIRTALNGARGPKAASRSSGTGREGRLISEGSGGVRAWDLVNAADGSLRARRRTASQHESRCLKPASFDPTLPAEAAI